MLWACSRVIFFANSEHGIRKHSSNTDNIVRLRLIFMLVEIYKYPKQI